jgi:hypothetical protein
MIYHLQSNIYLSILWLTLWISTGLALLLLIKPVTFSILIISIIFFMLSLFPIFIYLYNRYNKN